MTSPEAFPAASGRLPETETPSASYPDFTPGADAFALELRAESIEQLCGGDALRRGETERIEAGGSDGNADLVTGRDRVQVQGTLSEHTGHGLAVQAAHLDATVGGSFDTCAGKEDTVLLAGHMRDTWNGGTAVVVAMSDDLAAGGGVRATTPLDLWVHGLMGLEERPGTCTADGVLAEACGTLYEREYRSAVHAAGLAVFNGTLYQSVRNSFRPLMRISMGVRNLIAGGGGGCGGDAPSASSLPAPGGAVEQGAEAATDTLAAGRGAAQTPPPGTGAAHLDTAAVLTREADLAAAPNVLTELKRSADTAERLGGLRDVLRGAEAPPTGAEAVHLDGAVVLNPETDITAAPNDLAQLHRSTDPTERFSGLQDARRAAQARGDAAVGARTSRVEDAAFEPLAGDASGMLDGQPAAVALDPVAPSPRSGGPPAHGAKPRLGLLGGADEPNRPVPPGFDWTAVYRALNAQYRWHREHFNWSGIIAYREAIESITDTVMDQYAAFARRQYLQPLEPDRGSEAEQAYNVLRTWCAHTLRHRQWNEYETLRQALDVVEGIAHSAASALVSRADAIAQTLVPTAHQSGLTSRADPLALQDWLQLQSAHASRRWHEANRSGDPRAMNAATIEMNYFWRLSDEFASGRDPLPSSHQAMRELNEAGRDADAQQLVTLHVRLLQAMTRPAVHPVAMHPLPVHPLPVHPLPVHPVAVHPLAATTAGPAEIHRPSWIRQAGPVHPEPLSGFARQPLALGPGPAPGLSHPPLPGAAATGGPGRGPLDQPGPGADGATLAGVTTGGEVPHPDATAVMVTVQRRSGTVFWLQPAEPIPATSSVQFDTGLQQTGRQQEAFPPRRGEEAAGGGEAIRTVAVPGPATGATVGPPPAAGATGAFDPGLLGPSLRWVGDEFAVERHLNSGALPPGFDASALIGEWHWLTAGTPLESQLELGVLPTPTIDAMIASYSAAEGGRGHSLLVQQLQAMKESIAAALTAAYGRRADPDWLARVGLQPHRADDATAWLSTAQGSEIDNLLETTSHAPQPARLESATAPGRTEAGAGAFPRADEPRRSRSPGMRIGPARFGDGQTAGAVGAGPATTQAGTAQAWQAGRIPSFGLPASSSGGWSFRDRVGLVLRLTQGRALSEQRLAELIRLFDSASLTGMVGPVFAQQRPNLLRDLHRLADVARVSTEDAADLAGIDWSGIDSLLRLTGSTSSFP